MQKPTLTIFYQFNPWQSSIGGIQTYIRAFIKYAPEELDIRLVGTGEPGTSTGVWQEAELSGRLIQFMPLISLSDDNVRTVIPTTLRYTAALARHSITSDFMHFHRLEPSLPASTWTSEKTLFIHNDTQKQMNSSACKDAILWQSFPKIYFALESFLIHKFDHIYTFYSKSTEFYKSSYPKLAGQIQQFDLPIDTEIFFLQRLDHKERCKQHLMAQLGIPEKAKLLLFVGRLHPQKDPILLIRSLATLKDPNVFLVIAGTGEMKDIVCAEIEEHGLSKQVHLLGDVPQGEVANLYRACDLLVVTSAFEAGPLVILEALACGTPIVSTDCGQASRYILENNGILCKSREPQNLAGAIHKVLGEPDYYKAEYCIETAKPYGAQAVIEAICTQMLATWHKKQFNLN